MLAIEPFYQQIIAYDTRAINATNVTATIGVTRVAGYHDDRMTVARTFRSEDD